MPFNSNDTNSTDFFDFVCPAAGTIKNFRVKANLNSLDGNATITWRKGGVDQVSLTVGAGSTSTVSDTTSSFTVAAADLLDIKIVVAGTTGSISAISITAELAA